MIGEWSQKFNLVSDGDLEKIRERHFEDSLKLYELFPELTFQNAIDAGSGAGFPGIPLSIASPEKKFVLLESITKKCKFLNAVVERLQLSNVVVLNGRAEEFAREPRHRDQYDLACARALAHPPSAMEMVLPFVKLGGRGVFWASGPAWEDLPWIENIARQLGCEIDKEKTYHLTIDQRSRKLISLAKVKETPEKFPRRAGIPQKDPL